MWIGNEFLKVLTNMRGFLMPSVPDEALSSKGENLDKNGKHFREKGATNRYGYYETPEGKYL